MLASPLPGYPTDCYDKMVFNVQQTLANNLGESNVRHSPQQSVQTSSCDSSVWYPIAENDSGASRPSGCRDMTIIILILAYGYGLVPVSKFDEIETADVPLDEGSCIFRRKRSARKSHANPFI